jgi:general secretion pathway protein H
VPELTPKRQQGFTLLEMLVVVFIIALLASAAIIGLGATGKDSDMEKERDRLEALMSYVRERGAMLTLEYGIRCGQHGYRFVYFDNRLNQWQPETVDDTLRLRRLPKGLQFTLIIEGHQIVLDDRNMTIPKTLTTPAGGTRSTLGSGSDMPDSFSAPTSDNAPQILLLSNGDTNSFALTLTREGIKRSATLQSNADGKILASAIVEPK